MRQPSAVLRRAVSGLVSARCRRAVAVRPARSVPREDQLPVDPSTDVPDGISRRPARRAGRVRRRPRRHGHVGDLVADAADRVRLARRCRPLRADVPDGPASAGARHHPDVAVLHRCCARISSTIRCHGPTPPSPGGSSIPIARRCRSRRATSSRRWRCSRSTARTACATGRRAAGPGTDTAFDTNQMRVGRRLAIKLLNASRFALARTEPQGDDPVTAPSTARCCAVSRRSWTRRPRRSRGLRLRARAPADGNVLLAVLRRLSRAGEGAPLRRAGTEAGAASANAALAAALSVLLRLFAPFLPFVTEEVWSWWQTGSIHHGAVADARTSLSRCIADHADATRQADRARLEWATECCSKCGSSAPKPSSR